MRKDAFSQDHTLAQHCMDYEWLILDPVSRSESNVGHETRWHFATYSEPSEPPMIQGPG